jgi:hypothetical protein
VLVTWRVVDSVEEDSRGFGANGDADGLGDRRVVSVSHGSYSCRDDDEGVRVKSAVAEL